MFQLSTNLVKEFFCYLWYCGKKQIECGLVWHWWNSTDLGSVNWHVFKQSECRNCCLYNHATSEIWNYFQIWFFPRFGGKKWRRSEHVHASYLGLSFRLPGFSSCRGREERRVQGLDYLRLVIWPSMMLLGWTETELWTLKYGSKSIQMSQPWVW